MPITTEQLFDEPFYPRWMLQQALLSRWMALGKDLVARTDFLWKLEAQDTVERISAKYGRNGKPL